MTFNGENYLKNSAINAQRFNLEKNYMYQLVRVG
jgi:hypothetical protein